MDKEGKERGRESPEPGPEFGWWEECEGNPVRLVYDEDTEDNPIVPPPEP